MGGLDLVDAPGSAELQLTKEMATATMRTTTAAAITTVAIAVKQQPKMEKLGQNSANNANAWTLRISLITAPNVTKAKINVVWQTTKAMATVTTKTITVVAITTAVIAALRLSSKKFCKKCECIDPAANKCDKSKNKCGAAKFKGDGNCDDDNNNCGCDYDGGDCCAKTLKKAVEKKYCEKCECLDPKGK